MAVGRHIFKALDIRGKVGEDLTPEVAVAIGQGIGVSMRQRKQTTVVVGRDNRLSSPELAHGLIEGLLRSGCHVVDIGAVATPIVYYSAVVRGNVAGVMVTASHLGPQYNGFKLCIGARTLVGSDILQVYDIIAAGGLPAERGSVEQDDGDVRSYLDCLERVAGPVRRLKVVLDAGNGAAGPFAPEVFRALRYDAVPLFCEPDGSYPNHVPDPAVATNLTQLMAAVRRDRADLGFAYDGDADRVGVVDEQGSYVAADRVAVLIARDILSRRPGASFVLDILCSQVLVDEIRRAGGLPILWKSGHSFIKDKLHEEGAAFGVEMSGHMFFADDYYGYDDGIYASLRIASLVAAVGRPLSELMSTVPTLYATPEYRPHVAPGVDRFQIVRRVRDNLSGVYDVIDVDGVRVKFERGWGLLRASNTEEVLSLRFEGESEADALAYRELFRNELRAFPQVEQF